MTSPRFASYATWLLLWTMAHATDLKLSSSVRQESGFVSVNVGDKMTLRCVDKSDDAAWLYWYKQTLGQEPKLISSIYVYDAKPSFYHELKNNSRFKLDAENGQNHLTIFDLHISDSATYYCASSTTFVLTFAEGTFVSVKGSGLKIPTSVHQSASETIQPGGSVTLNCTVHTGTCDGQHSVYWFKDSEESHPGLIYTDGGRNDQCERKPNTQTHTCVYNLPMKSLNLSHAGTYYCAVASCGHILFGDGTKLDFEDELVSLVPVYCLSGALAFTTILVVLLGFLVYKVNKKNICQCSESHARSSAPSTANTEGYRNADSPHYAALSVNLPMGTRRQRNNTNDECVYASVKL
ncbi:immunoglobulin kappa light chain-like [Anarhichas minor]|uniref:immunoglobulin kappa light chain-like n=1 Tax=Anarhichas minor TaxID=65739 RepID=UPI003F73829B